MQKCVKILEANRANHKFCFTNVAFSTELYAQKCMFTCDHAHSFHAQSRLEHDFFCT